MANAVLLHPLLDISPPVPSFTTRNSIQINNNISGTIGRIYDDHVPAIQNEHPATTQPTTIPFSTLPPYQYRLYDTIIPTSKREMVYVCGYNYNPSFSIATPVPVKPRMEYKEIGMKESQNVTQNVAFKTQYRNSLTIHIPQEYEHEPHNADNILFRFNTPITTSTATNSTASNPKIIVTASKKVQRRKPSRSKDNVRHVDMKTHKTTCNDDKSSKHVRMAKDQRAKLLEVFESKGYPSFDERRCLAESLGVSERKIQVWFQNERAKLKRRDVKKPLIVVSYDSRHFAQDYV